MVDFHNGTSILAVGAHPDDAEIGCGYLLWKYQAQPTFVISLTNGALKGSAELRSTETAQAAACLGLTNHAVLPNIPDGELGNHTSEAIRQLDQYIELFQPTLLLSHGPQARHPDHVAAHQIALYCTRYVRNVLWFDDLSSIAFNPTVFLPMPNPYHKMHAVEKHASQGADIRARVLELGKRHGIAGGYEGFAEGYIPFSLEITP